MKFCTNYTLTCLLHVSVEIRSVGWKEEIRLSLKKGLSWKHIMKCFIKRWTGHVAHMGK
jgi:hypothetical protein